MLDAFDHLIQHSTKNSKTMHDLLRPVCTTVMVDINCLHLIIYILL